MHRKFGLSLNAITIENWDSKVPTQTREKRYIITGNLLQALVDTEKGEKTTGNLISYSTIDGETRQGILMGENFKPADLRNNAEPDAAWDAIVSQANGDESIASEVVSDVIAERQETLDAAEKALADVKNAKPAPRKKGDPAPTMDERIAAKVAAAKALSDAQAARDAAQAAVEHWQQIAGTVQRREDARRAAEVAEAQRQEEAEPSDSGTGATEDSGQGGEVVIIDPREMSDEERTYRGAMLRNAPAIIVAQGIITSHEGKSARKVAEEWWDKNVGEPILFETEAGEVEIDKTSIKDSLSHGYRQEKLDAVTSLAEGFRNAVYLGSMEDFNRPGVMSHYFAYPINYDGQRRYVFCRAMANNNKNRLYVHEVFMADGIKESDTLQTIASASKDGELHGGIALYKAILKNVLDVSERKDNTLLSDKQEVEAESSVHPSDNKGTQTVQRAIEAAESEVNTEPTEAQKAAGNYKKGHVRIDGLDITIENPKGSKRSGKDADGKEWETEMQNTYGYIKGTTGVDGDKIDVFLSDNPSEGNVFVIDQYNKDGSFDEHKVMYGFASAEEAKAAYLSNYSADWAEGRRIDVTGVSKAEFKKWLDASNRKTKPFAEYKSVRTIPAEVDVLYRAAMSREREDFDSLKERAVTERGIVMPGLNEATVKMVEVPQHDFAGTGKEALRAAEAWAKEHIVGTHTATDSRGLEFEYSISNDAVEKYVSRSATGKSENIGVHLAALKMLPEIIGDSIEAEVHPDYTKKEGERSAQSNVNQESLIHRFYGAVNIDGKIYRVKTTMREYKDFNRDPLAYSYEITQIELLEAPSDGALKDSGEPLAMTSNSSIDVAKLLQGVEKSYDPGKKLLDESESLDERQRMGDGYGAYTDAEASYINDPVSKVMGKNRFSKKRQAEFAAHERQRMATRIQELADRMHLDNVEVVTDASQLEGKRATAKGFYNKRTGKITIVIPNNASTIDAEQTLLHEAVAHYGLRQLFGKQFDTFLDNVYQNADGSIRRKIAEMAAQNGWNFRTATEEYLAGLAEDMNFEEASRESGWWSKIKSLFLDMVEALGFKGFRDREGAVLTDNELRYILWRSYENLKNGGERGLLSEAEDVAKQSELKVGNYAESGIEAEYAAEPISVANDSFNQQLQRWADGAMRPEEIVSLGTPMGIMRGFLANIPILIRQKVLSKARKKHGLAAADMKNLPEALAKPIFVFKSSPETISVLTMLKSEKGDNLFVAIELDKDLQMGGRNMIVNDILTIHGREVENVVLPIIQNRTLAWVDKEKGLEWLHSAKSKSQAITNQDLEYSTKIVKNFENPTIEEEELFRPGDFTPRDRVTARDTYERMVSRGSYQFQEAVQDSMLGLKKLYQAILGKKTQIEDVADFENAYEAENLMTSATQAQQHEYLLKYMKPLLLEIGKICGANTRKREELTDYMMAKHGLERNAYMRAEKSFGTWTFICLLALQWYYDLSDFLKNAELNNKFAPQDMVRSLSRVRTVRIDKKWIPAGIMKMDRQLVEAAGLDIMP